MKKIILLSLLTFTISFASKAQTGAAVAMTKGVAAALVNTASDTATIKASGVYENVSFQTVTTKVSGTVAGKTFLWASLDGTNFVKLTNDSAVLANQTTNTHIFTPGASKYLYYKLITTGVGTMNATIKGWFLGR